MAIQQMLLDPNAASYTDDQIVGKVNTATANITRAGSVAAAARPIGSGEVTNTELALLLESLKAIFDAMTDATRGYVKTSPVTGQFKVVAVQRASDGKLQISYDDVPA